MAILIIGLLSLNSLRSHVHRTRTWWGKVSRGATEDCGECGRGKWSAKTPHPHWSYRPSKEAPPWNKTVATGEHDILLYKLVSDVLHLLYALLGELAENRITRLIRLRVLVSIQIVNGTFGLGGELGMRCRERANQLLPHLNLVLLLGTTLQIVVERSAITVAVEHLDESIAE